MTKSQALGVALFSVKSFVAAILAYYIALRIGLTRPFWAVTTCYIVAQPLAGAVLSKAAFRVMGTALGAIAAVVLVLNLVNSPELLSIGLALWLAFCLYISLQDRTPRSYVFLLAGYTASIIGFPSVSSPGAIFDIASLRIQEIVIGIVCGSFVHAAILPRTVTDLLLSRIDAILLDVERWSRDSLKDAADATLDRDRRRLALDINELHQLSTHLPFDTAAVLPRVRTVRALQDQLSLLLPLSSAADDRLAALREGSGGVPLPVEALIDRICAWLSSGPDSPADRVIVTESLIADAQALEPDVDPDKASPTPWRDALTLSLLARLADLVATHHKTRDLRDQIRSTSRTPISPVAAEALQQATRRDFHRDRPAAFRAAAAAFTTILLGCAFWIGTAWADGAGAVLISGVCCALFANTDNAASLMRTFFYGSVFGIGLAGIYAYGIMPRITDFVPLIIMLSPVFLIAGGMLAIPRLGLLALGFLIGFINNVGLVDRYNGDFIFFLNGGIAQLAGILFAIGTIALFQAPGTGHGAARLLEAGWRDLARRSNLRRMPDIAGWNSRMLDRIGLLAPRLAAQGRDPGKPMLDALIDLRVGITVGELRRLRQIGTPAHDAMITPVLSEVARHYAEIRADQTVAEDHNLLTTIDQALTDFMHQPQAQTRRDALLALVGLRRNLFPTAGAYGDGVAA
ncbi:FUSC family protein [soil metagenome]